MQTAASNSLILTSFPSFKRGLGLPDRILSGGLYQHIPLRLTKHAAESAAVVGYAEGLMGLADRAYGFREMETVARVSDLLLTLPLPRSFTSAGRYYRALCLRRQGQFESAAVLLETVLREPKAWYVARSLQCLGAISLDIGDIDSALALRVEACRAASSGGLPDPVTAIHSQMEVAIIKSLEGYHDRALGDLEKLFPLVRSIRRWQPRVYYDYLNSLAVEMSHLGRFEEAQNLCNVVLASPFASAYPEWRETQDEVALRGRRPSRSVVAFSRGARFGGDDVPVTNQESPSVVAFGHSDGEASNVVRLPLADENASAAIGTASDGAHSARVLSFQGWKNRMGEQSSGRQHETLSRKEILRMTKKEKLVRLLELIAGDDTSDETLREMLEFAERIKPTGKNNPC